METIYARLRETKPISAGQNGGKTRPRAGRGASRGARGHRRLFGGGAANGKRHVVDRLRSVRHQEEFYDEFLTWCRNALIFPEQEIAVTEGAVPDLEIAAKRYAVLERLVTKERQEIVVIHEGSLAHARPFARAASAP